MKSQTKRKHRGSIRNERRVRYAEAALTAALADPDMRGHVALVGGLFSSRRGRKVTAQQMSRALAARHPLTGKLLRKRVNAGLRWEGDSLVSNVCHGFDIPLSVDKSISIAALVFGDDAVLKLAMNAMRQSARCLSKKMDRRLRRGGQNGTVETGNSAVFFIPEKAGRNGQPQLHAHLIIPNLTSFQEDGRTRHAAGHFRRITRSALQAQQRMNRQLGRNLTKAGYAIEMVNGVCRLPGVSRALCDELSPVSKMLNSGKDREGTRRRSTRAALHRRENSYLKDRAKKIHQPLAQWRKNWAKAFGAERLKAEMLAYYTARFQKPVESEAAPVEVVPFVPEVAVPVEVIAALQVNEAQEEDLEDRTSMRPNFSSLGVALRKKVTSELTYEARNQVIELDYTCPERARHLVEHTEALRTLLRLIFPRIIVHQKFSPGEHSRFKVTGGAAANPVMAYLIAATAAALEVELGQDVVRANWPAVLRWLHSELANRAPEPVVVVRRARAAPKIKPITPPAETPTQTQTAHPAPPPPEPPLPPVVDGPELEIMP